MGIFSNHKKKAANFLIKQTMHLLPQPDPAILKTYTALVTEIDQIIAGLSEHGLAATLRCRPGCSDCCIAFSVLPLEAAILQAGLAAADWPALAAPRDGFCAFLQEDGLCRFYGLRPLLCRTQGMALAYIDESSGTIEVSACPVNFPADFSFTQEDLLFMDELNRRLAELNLVYCRQAGLQPDCRIALADIAVSPPTQALNLLFSADRE
jgi:Fe-S-cluster containining protein